MRSMGCKFALFHHPAEYACGEGTDPTGPTSVTPLSFYAASRLNCPGDPERRQVQEPLRQSVVAQRVEHRSDDEATWAWSTRASSLTALAASGYSSAPMTIVTSKLASAKGMASSCPTVGLTGPA